MSSHPLNPFPTGNDTDMDQPHQHVEPAGQETPQIAPEIMIMQQQFQAQQQQLAQQHQIIQQQQLAAVLSLQLEAAMTAQQPAGCSWSGLMHCSASERSSYADQQSADRCCAIVPSPHLVWRQREGRRNNDHPPGLSSGGQWGPQHSGTAGAVRNRTPSMLLQRAEGTGVPDQPQNNQPNELCARDQASFS